MVSVSLSERAVLDELEPQWRKLGYTLLREPRQDQLPDFLRGFRPDAIAVGAKPSLVIEILRARSGSSETKIRQIRSLFEGHDDWRLEVIYVAPDGAPIQPVSWQDIGLTLQNLKSFSGTEPKAALLMAWSTLEAVGRALEPSLASRGLPPHSLVEILISNGHVPQADGPRLRQIGSMRNALAHGQINETPTADDVRYLIGLLERMVAIPNAS